MNKYSYIHHVCFWVGNMSRICNLYEHVKMLKGGISIPNKESCKILCIFSIMTDDYNDISIEKLRKEANDKVDIEILYWDNSGGTVKALYNVYKWLLNKSIVESKDIIVGTWEDDWCFNSSTWLEKIYDKLSSHIYVGALFTDNVEFLKVGYKFLSTYKDVNENTYNNTTTLSVRDHNGFIPQNYYKWTDGSPYITTFGKLKEMENLIGEFSLAPSEKYMHGKHGIYHGEVGFPTRLSVAGMTFYGFNYTIFVKPLKQETNVIHK